MRKPTYDSDKALSQTGWWKHARFGKRVVNKSERHVAKRELIKQAKKINPIWGLFF